MSNGNGSNGGERSQPPKVPVMQLFERANRKGERYFVGRSGIAKRLIMSRGRANRYARPVWQAFSSEGDALEQAAVLAREFEEEGVAGAYTSPASYTSSRPVTRQRIRCAPSFHRILIMHAGEEEDEVRQSGWAAYHQPISFQSGTMCCNWRKRLWPRSCT